MWPCFRMELTKSWSLPNDVNATWALWRIKHQKWQFVPQFPQADSQENIQVTDYWSTMDSPHKGSEMWKAFPWHDIVLNSAHHDVIKWKHFSRYWPFVRGIHRSPVNSPHKGQWRGALMFSLICDWINDWINNREAGDLRRHRAHNDIIVTHPRLSYSDTFSWIIEWGIQ